MKKIHRFLAFVLFLALLCSLLPVREAEAAVDKSIYKSLEEAAEYVRKKMAAQEKTIRVRFYLEDPRIYGPYNLTPVLLDEVYKHTGVGDEGDYLKWSTQSWGIDETEEFDGKTHYVYSTITVREYNADAKQEKELDQKLARVMESLELAGKSDYEKIKTIYRYICENVHYSPEVLTDSGDPMVPEQGLNQYYSAYGALVLGSATCQGYTSLVYRMMLEAGIDCRIIAGDNHAWNIVRLDGQYYYLDATFDEGAVEDPKYFLLGSASFREKGHESWYYQFNREFLDEYPISVLDYGAEDLTAGKEPTAVIGSGSCGNSAMWELTADGHMRIFGTGSMWNKSTYDCYYWPGMNGYIKTVEIEPGITSIGNYGFYNCPQLSRVTIADSVTSIGRDAFSLCESLTEITIPDSVHTVGVRTFCQCVRLESATLSAGMKTVPMEMFIGCTGLKRVTIPEGIQQMDEAAFSVCYSLEDIRFPSTLTTLGTAVFFQAFDPDAQVCLTLPETITDVGVCCFEDSAVKEVIWNAKADVSDAALHRCVYLEKATFRDDILNFHFAALSACFNLTELTLPAGLKKLGSEALRDCLSLTELTIPEGLTELGDCVFNDCDGLKELIFPATLSQMGDTWFWLNENLRTVIFQGQAPKLVLDRNGSVTYPEESKLTIYYPEGDPTWTESFQDEVAGGAVKWKPTHTVAAGHTFKEYRYKDAVHWSVCRTCPITYDEQPHEFDSDCAEQCKICPYKRTAPHKHDGSWQQDGQKHWQVCLDCAAVRDEEEHSFDEGQTRGHTVTYTCTVCGFGRTEELPTEPTTQPTETLPPQPEQPEQGPAGIAVIGILAAVCLAGVTVILLKKNKPAAR